MNNEVKTPHLPITVYHSWESGNAKNCRYPNTGIGRNSESIMNPALTVLLGYSLMCYPA